MNTRSKGTGYEETAAAHLKDAGYTILEKNFRCKFGEIDIVAMDGDCLVFVEVKHRRNEDTGGPLAAVDFRKQRRISMTAKYYMMKHRVSEFSPIRFDVMGYLGDELTHVKNAFEYVWR